MKLLEPLAIGGRTAANRVMFGPHETNLAWGRALSDRHRAYYEERAVGGAGLIVVEEASVHTSDWPYERSPAAEEAAGGWMAIGTACRPHGALVVAALGHSGGQGSSAFSQRELWAPSDEPEVNSREAPKIMEPEDIQAVIDGFGAAAASARVADLDGVEVNAGQHSLIRQFLSGLTNRRNDHYGADRLRFAHEVLAAARSGIGHDRILGLRISCDELAPWAGITPEAAVEVCRELAPVVDYLVVVRGAIFSVAETRPTGHHGAGFNIELARTIRDGLDRPVPVFVQGSIVDPDQAEHAIESGAADGVEMTRAQIAEPNLVARLSSGRAPRPCVLCNQRCKVRDNRNPIVSCIAEPRSGYETIDPSIEGMTSTPLELLVVGGGPAGLEASRVAALRGHRVRLLEAATSTGGLLGAIAAAPGHEHFAALATWLADEAVANGVEIITGTAATVESVESWPGPVVLATGSTTAAPSFEVDLTDPDRGILRALDVFRAAAAEELTALPERLIVWDPIGNSVAVAVAELLRRTDRAVTFITPDAIVGDQLSLTGDLAGSNVRLQQAGVRIERRQRLLRFAAGTAATEHRFTGERQEIEADAVVDCGARVPDTDLITDRDVVRVGDAVAARTVGEAIREGRAAVFAIERSARSARVEVGS